VCSCDDKSYPSLRKKNIFKNNNDNFGTEGVRKSEHKHTENDETKAETQPEASILPTNAYTSNMPRKLRKLHSKISVIKTIDAYS